MQIAGAAPRETGSACPDAIHPIEPRDRRAGSHLSLSSAGIGPRTPAAARALGPCQNIGKQRPSGPGEEPILDAPLAAGGLPIAPARPSSPACPSSSSPPPLLHLAFLLIRRVPPLHRYVHLPLPAPELYYLQRLSTFRIEPSFLKVLIMDILYSAASPVFTAVGSTLSAARRERREFLFRSPKVKVKNVARGAFGYFTSFFVYSLANEFGATLAYRLPDASAAPERQHFSEFYSFSISFSPLLIRFYISCVIYAALRRAPCRASDILCHRQQRAL